MNTYFRCLESRIDKNNTLYGKFSLNSILSGQGNTFANSLRRSLFSDLSGLAITHFCITSKPGLGYEFSTLPGLTESLLDFSLNLKKVVLTGRVINHELQNIITPQLKHSTIYDLNLPINSAQSKVNVAVPKNLSLFPSRSIKNFKFPQEQGPRKVFSDHWSQNNIFDTSFRGKIKNLKTQQKKSSFLPLKTEPVNPKPLEEIKVSKIKLKPNKIYYKNFLSIAFRSTIRPTIRKSNSCSFKIFNKNQVGAMLTFGGYATYDAAFISDRASMSGCCTTRGCYATLGCCATRGRTVPKAATRPTVVSSKMIPSPTMRPTVAKHSAVQDRQVKITARLEGHVSRKSLSEIIYLSSSFVLRTYLQSAKLNKLSLSQFLKDTNLTRYNKTKINHQNRTVKAKQSKTGFNSSATAARPTVAKLVVEARREAPYLKNQRSFESLIVKVDKKGASTTNLQRSSLTCDRSTSFYERSSSIEGSSRSVVDAPRSTYGQVAKQKMLTSLPVAPIGFLKAKGPAVLRASDLILPPGIRCVHPNQYLGTLAADGALSLKFLIAAGKGFIVQDEILYNSLSRAKLLPSSTTDYSLGYNDNVVFESDSKDLTTQSFCNVGQIAYPLGYPSSNYLHETSFTRPTVDRDSSTAPAQQPTLGQVSIVDRSAARKIKLTQNFSFLNQEKNSPSLRNKQSPIGINETNIKQKNFHTKIKNLSEYAPLLNCYLFCLLRHIDCPSLLRVRSDLGSVSTNQNIPKSGSLAHIVGRMQNGGMSTTTKRTSVTKSVGRPSTSRPTVEARSVARSQVIEAARQPYSMFFVGGGGVKLKSFQNPATFLVKNLLSVKELPSKKNNLFQKIPLNLYTSSPTQLLPLATKALAHFFTRNLSIASISDLILVVRSHNLVDLPTTDIDVNVTSRNFTQPTVEVSNGKLDNGTSLSNYPVMTEKNSTKLANAAFSISNKENLNSIVPEFLDDKLEKERLLTIAYKAQSSKFSPFLFATISTVGRAKFTGNKKAKNKNLSIKNHKRLAKFTLSNKNSHADTVDTVSELPSTDYANLTSFAAEGSRSYRPHQIARPGAQVVGVGSPVASLPIQNSFPNKSYKAQHFLPPAANTLNVNNNQVFKKLSKKQLIWGAEENFYPVLPLDVTFTPVSKVNFQINVNRNSEKNEETIVLEIWTNGSITPKRAIQESCLALSQDFYNLFCRVNEFSSLQFWWKRESLESKITAGAGVAYNSSSIDMAASNRGLLDSAYKNLQSRRKKHQDKLYYLTLGRRAQLGTSQSSSTSFATSFHRRSRSSSIFGETNYAPTRLKLQASTTRPQVVDASQSKFFEYLPGVRHHSEKKLSDLATLRLGSSQNHKNSSKIEDFKTSTGNHSNLLSNKLNGKFTESPSMGAHLQSIPDGVAASLENNKKTHSQVKNYSKVKFSESKNLKLKQKVHYLHAFWRLNVNDLNLSLKTQLLLKKLDINNVYDLHFFILKKSWSLFLNHQQQKEIVKIYLNFGLNSPF